DRLDDAERLMRGDLRTDLRQLDEDDVAQLLLREVRDPDPDAIALPLGPLVLARVLEIARNVSHGSSYLPSEPLRRAPGLDGRRINTSFSFCRRSPFAGLRGSTVGESTRRSLFAVRAPSPGSGARRSANQHVVLFLPSEPLRRAPGLDGRRINTSFSFCRRSPFAGLQGSTVGESTRRSLFHSGGMKRCLHDAPGLHLGADLDTDLGTDRG